MGVADERLQRAAHDERFVRWRHELSGSVDLEPVVAEDEEAQPVGVGEVLLAGGGEPQRRDVMSCWRRATAAGSVSRAVVRPRMSAATPLVIMSCVHVSRAVGEITDSICGLASNSASISANAARLAGLNRSTTVRSAGIVNSTTMFSPPNSDWYCSLSAATCDAGSM